MDWFQVPENYECIQRSNDTTLYAWNGNTRDTYVVNGLSWEKTASTTYNYGHSDVVCVQGAQIPSQITPWFIGCAFVLMLVIFNHILKMILGVRR